jgi:TatA/E family protein of Tat protein translocase
MFGSIGPAELILIFVIALLVFGPKKLPEIGRSIGKAMREFKKSTEEIKEKFEEQIRADEFKTIQDDIKKDLGDIGGLKALGDDLQKDISGDGEGKKDS